MMNLDAERALLGVALVKNEVIDLVTLSPDDFASSTNRMIFEKFVDWRKNKVSFDLVTLYNALNGMVHTSYLDDAILCGVPLMVPEYERLIKHAAVIRQVKILCKAFLDEKPTEASDYLDRVQQSFTQLKLNTKSKFIPVKEAILNTYNELGKVKNGKKRAIGLETGFYDLDLALSGLQPATLTIIAGRPSMGKSSLALCIADNAAQKGHCVAYYSLEDSTSRIAFRLLSKVTMINSMVLRSGGFSSEHWQKITQGANRWSHVKFLIDDSSGMSSQDIIFNARLLNTSEKINLLIIDHLQLIREKRHFESRHQEISFISNRMKALAKEINAPVILVSQLSRTVETKSDKRPELFHLKESGDIEQDADNVLLLYREKYYQPKIDDSSTEVIVAKCRDGARGKVVKLYFDEGTTSFHNYTREENYV